MLEQDETRVDDIGNGYVIGEVKHTKKLKYLEDGTLYAQFEGLDKCLDYVLEKMPEAKRGGSSVDTGRGSFNAFDTYEEAITTFRKTPEKVVHFDESELRIKDDSESGNQIEYDVTGDYIDMGRFMEGVPESMGTMHNGNARNRRINLIVNLNQAHYIDHEDVTHRSERILRLVDALEAGGVRTQLTGILSNECLHVEVNLKHHDETLTIADLAVTTHPEFLRRIGFRFCEYSKTWDYGYGSAVKFGRALTPELLEGTNVNEMNIFIDANMQSRETIDRLFDQIERLLVWEMSKPVPEVSSIKLSEEGIFFQANGSRSEAEIKREGQEVINNE